MLLGEVGYREHLHVWLFVGILAIVAVDLKLDVSLHLWLGGIVRRWKETYL